MYTTTRHPHIHTRKDVLVLLSRIHPVHDDREMEWKEEYTVYYTYVLYFMMVNLYGTDVLGVCVCVSTCDGNR
jgi:hypothetical protein